MISLSIERANNGWVLTSLAVVGKTMVYTEEEALLNAIHRLINPDWEVGDRVIIQKKLT